MNHPRGKNSGKPETPGKEIYLEFQIIGQFQKVTAIDPVTHVEVSVSGPKSTPRDHISRLAVRKLQRRIDELCAKNNPAPKGRYI